MPDLEHKPEGGCLKVSSKSSPASVAGAIAGMVAGGAMVFIWKYLIAPMGGAWAIYELLPAFLVGLVLMVIVSLCTKAPSKEITDEFDRVKAMGKAK